MRGQGTKEMKSESVYFKAVIKKQNPSWINSFGAMANWFILQYKNRQTRAYIMARACVRLTNLLVNSYEIDNLQPSDVDYLITRYKDYNNLKLTEHEIILIGYEIYDGFFDLLTISEYKKEI